MFGTHIIGNASWPKEKNFRYHLPRITQDLFMIHFLPIGKSKIQPFWRAGRTQEKWSAKYGPNGLYVSTAISKWAGILICSWVKNEPKIGPHTTTQDNWYRNIFSFGQQALPMMCG